MTPSRYRVDAWRKIFSVHAFKLRFGFRQRIDVDSIAPTPLVLTGPLKVRIAADGEFARAARAALARLSSTGLNFEEAPHGNADIHIAGGCGLDNGALRALAASVVVVGRFATAADFVAPWEAPVCATDETGVEGVLRWLGENRATAVAIGAQGRRYVARWHSRQAVRARLLARPYSIATLAKRYLVASVIADVAEDTADALDWLHPFRVGCRHAVPPEIQGRAAPDIRTAIDVCGGSATFRWWLARGQPPPWNGWTSYDRKPWRHPWLTAGNIGAFAEFSRTVMTDLAARAEPPQAGHYAFVGNLANANYMRTAALARAGLDIDIHLHPDDRSIQSQPFWEDFDGTIGDLGDDPARSAFDAPLPPRVHRIAQDANWGTALADMVDSPLTPADVLTAPAFPAYYPQFNALKRYDAALYCQIISLAPLAGRPWLIAPTGGDMWFDPSRADAYGRIARRALRDAYAVIVSNPITLAHARRYEISNLVYLPFCIDETRYCPGDESAIRSNWMQRSGGEFFVLCTMRLDNLWKGSDIALDGFAAFARRCPGARLVLTSWGANEAQSRQRLADLAILDKVLVEPLCGKARLARMLRAADAFIEQFVLGYYGAAGLEALASGLPVIMRLEREQYDALVPAGAPPVLDAPDAAGVTAHLSRLYRDPAFRTSVAEASRAWFMRTHASQACAPDYAALLIAAARGLPIDWRRSPLASPLGSNEAAHHASGLDSAPPFPNYEI